MASPTPAGRLTDQPQGSELAAAWRWKAQVNSDLGDRSIPVERKQR
jgi:hypothetical protein